MLNPDPIRLTYAMAENRYCRFHGRSVQLTRKQTSILEYLLIRRGNYCSMEELIEYVYPDPDTQALTANEVITVLISRMRKVLPGVILTYQGKGYLIERPRAVDIAA